MSHSVFFVTLPLVIITRGFAALTDEVVEAAEAMGARPVQVFRTVVLPLIAPHVLTGFTLVAIISVNEYLIANMISGFVVETLPIKIFNNVRYGYSSVVAAASMLFEGIVEAVTYKTDQGFTVGQIDISVANGTKMRVSFKNENMACWLNGTVFATVPDLICLFDLNSGAPVANPDCRAQQNISVVILPAPKEFRTDKGLSIFGPNYAGIDATFRTPLSI